jgi:hypothetical protein
VESLISQLFLLHNFTLSFSYSATAPGMGDPLYRRVLSVTVDIDQLPFGENACLFEEVRLR